MPDERAHKYDLFISYNRADEEWAERLAARLEQEDYEGRKLKVFFAPWDIPPGEYITEKLEDALPRSRKVGLIVTPEAMRSEWVKIERLVTTHIDTEERRRRLIPLYRRPPDELPALLRGIKAIDFEQDAHFEKGYRELLAVVRGEPLPRGERRDAAGNVLPPPPIPRPPVFGFVTRRDDKGRDIVERLQEELAPERKRLATLSGPGGIGKTTLAAEAARALQETYENRVVWSSAEGRNDFSLLTLLDDIATQLGRADLRTLAPSAKEEQVRALVAAPAALVVLDNYETIDAAEKRRIEAWFRSAQCSALFTSRPRIAGTLFLRVSDMSRKEAEEFLNNLIGQAQDEKIFSAKVRRDIYRTARANPFVMQWVFGQIDSAQEPKRVLKELAEGEGDAAERVFTRSFNLPEVGDDGRAALLALSLFVPNASREALAAAAGFGDDQKRLDEAVKHLHALWLIKTSDENRRLALEGLTRSMAAARLSKDPRARDFRHRFVAYFLRYTVERKERTPENYDALEAEKDNLLAAAEAAFNSEDWESVMRMAYALAADGMLYVRGYWDEAVRLGEQALQAARSSKDEPRVAGLSHNIAVLYEERGEPVKARRLYDESLEIKKRLGDQIGVAITLHELGRLAQNRGELQEARHLYDESLEIKKRLGDEGYVATTLHHLGMLAHAQGKVEEARRLYDESLEIKKRLGHQRGIAITLHQLGVLAHAQGEVEEAQRFYSESLEIKKRLGHQGGIANTLRQLGILAQDRDEVEQARRLYDESLEIVKRLGDQRGVANSLHQLGRLAEEEGNREEAVRLFRESLTILERLGSPNADVARRNLARVEGESS